MLGRVGQLVNPMGSLWGATVCGVSQAHAGGVRKLLSRFWGDLRGGNQLLPAQSQQHLDGTEKSKYHFVMP